MAAQDLLAYVAEIGSEGFVVKTRSILLVMGVSLAAICSDVLAEETIVEFAPAPGPLDNPLKGWCPYTDAGEIHQPYSMVYFYVPWKKLEPAEGHYQFEDWEHEWDVDQARGKHIIFRVYIDYPSEPSGLPDWLRTAGVKETPYKDHGGGRSPDYDDPRMVKAMTRLIAALGKQYNNHPRIAFVQLGLLGFWGEWHTWPTEKLAPSLETERRVIDAYRAAFPNKSLMVRYSRDYAGKQAWIGFHDDMFPQDTDNGKDWSFLAGVRKANRNDNWKTAVVGGEMVPNKAKKWLGDGFDTTLEMAKRAHFTWVGPYCPALERSKDEMYRQRSEALVRKMGYEYQLAELKHSPEAAKGQAIRLSLKGANTGVAPFYYPWPVELALINSAGDVVGSTTTGWDIRTWLPGTFVEDGEFTFDVPPGEYELALGIRDPWTKLPRIRFANELRTAKGWSLLSRVRIR